MIEISVLTLTQIIIKFIKLKNLHKILQINTTYVHTNLYLMYNNFCDMV